MTEPLVLETYAGEITSLENGICAVLVDTTDTIRYSVDLLKTDFIPGPKLAVGKTFLAKWVRWPSGTEGWRCEIDEDRFATKEDWDARKADLKIFEGSGL